MIYGITEAEVAEAVNSTPHGWLDWIDHGDWDQLTGFDFIVGEQPPLEYLIFWELVSYAQGLR